MVGKSTRLAIFWNRYQDFNKGVEG
jgi:hypothetical protein